IKRNHPSINYYIKKQIITNNLYGVDLMEEATEIAKLRLFLALVASAETADQLEPLPNIDFNIMNGNSLIGLMRVDESEYNKHQTGDLFKTSYHELVQKREAAIRAFKSFENTDENNQIKKETIDRMEEEAYETLNLMLGQEFNNLNIKYEQVTWNDKTSEEGKTIKRSINIKDVIALEPFHWGYKFSEIFRKKNGFDAIITNPPWETFQPNAREFAMEHSTNVFLKKMDNKDFISELQVLMKNDKIREEYLKYNSYYNHTRQYYRVANQYLNQVPIINGKRHGKDINLYKLFLEQSYNLIKQNGYCGIVIPSGIYTDLGSKKLREMLFEKTKITGLFSFENKKEIFEGVHRSFKFVVLSFEKGGKTMEFPSAFMRHDVEELENFPQFGASNISVEFVRKQSPESLSISELKSAMDFVIADKIIQFPFLSDKIKGKWNIEYQREFNMTDDAYLFVKQKSKNSLPLFEGKMIWQYTHRYAEPKFWIDAKEGRNALLGRLTDTKQILSYQKYRLTYRDISSPTNERTMINTILPPNVFTGNTLYVSKNDIAYSDMLIIVAFLNSFINDYVIRQKITSHCNMFYVYQLSVPRLSKQDKWYQAIAERAAKLICVVSEFSDLWTDVMKTKWSEKDTLINDFDRNVIRAELDGIIAHNYSLTEEEFNYVLNTFPIVSQPQKVAALNAYRDVERGLIKPV
ncbi:MAG TPA: Eco57I restriction-modification methylase domain-containing protein, partial [Chitinophagaceae bacterium]|nr:Eco57I restriction-modification methylase domain-containing protein [Chitinophagaceae bacterium]